MSKFKVGDHVEVVSSPNMDPESIVFNGYCGVITSQSPYYEKAWRVDELCDGDGRMWAFDERRLRLRRPPSWDKWLYATDKLDDVDQLDTAITSSLEQYLAKHGAA